MAEPIYDDLGIPLTRSGVCERIWALQKNDPAAFKREVNAYFALAYPGFKAVKASYNERIIWLKDERRRMF
jgi:hypothetical protein